MKKHLLLSIIFAFTFSALTAQLNNNMKITRITMEDGLPGTDLNLIFRDSKGFMWIGTFGSGLYRYDGYSFTEFRYEPGLYETDTNVYLANNAIYCMLEDKNGILWIGSINGLYRCNPAESESISKRYLLDKIDWRKNDISAIYDDNKGNLWIGTLSGKRIAIFNKIEEEFRFIKLHPDKVDIPDNENFEVRSIIKDKDNNMWFGTSRGLYKYNMVNKTFRVYRPAPDNILNRCNIITSLFCEESSNMIWVGTGRGLFVFDKEKEEFELKFPDVFNEIDLKNEVFGFKRDDSGNIWFRTYLGIFCFKPGTKQLSIKEIYALQQSNIWTRSFEFDESGNIWLGIWNEGINIITVENRNFRAMRGDPNNSNSLNSGASSVCEDNEGNIWIGTWTTGLTKYNKIKNEFTHYVHNPVDSTSLSSNTISYVYMDHTGTLWVGTDGSGLNKMIINDNDQVQFKRYLHDPERPGSISSNKIFRIIEDKEKDLWILAYNSIDKYDRERDVFINLNVEPDCINSGPCELEEMQNETWFPSWNEINRIVPPYTAISDYEIKASQLIRYKHDPEDPLSMECDNLTNTYCISQIYQPGTLWFGTQRGGLGKMIKNRNKGKINRAYIFKYYTKEDGFTGNYIQGILEDKSGNLWISTDKGLFKFNPRNELFTSYSVLDMFGTNMFTGWEPCIDSEGLMYFPHFFGLLIVNADSMQNNIKKAPVIITDFKINGKQVNIGENSPLKRTISYTEEIELEHNQNYLSFEFVVLDYISSERNQYRYILEGLDKNWINAGNRRIANYSNLKHGKYIFRVQGAGSNGIWNTEGASVKIIIRPPWWETNIAYISYIVLAFLIIAAYIRIRTRRLKKEKDELERLVQERTHQIQEANEELLQQKEEIQTTLDHLRQTQEQLIESEKMAALGGLVAGVAHEINTPVGITVTAASGLMEETKKMAVLYKENKISRAEFKDYLNNTNQSVKLILSNMERTETMIQSFKQVSVDQSTENKRSFRLKSYTEDVIRSLYPKLKKRKIHIKLDIDEELEIDSYPGAYSQIITNLVLNSITHGFDEKYEGKIELKADNKNGELALEYKDNGKGISQENKKKIFNPFFTTNKNIGTGLGMHIVYNLVTQKLKGNIECISKPGEGVIFKMQIPLK
jgi:signal transduction histidine kinase/ligand-binding sensor domain-containing protein